MLALLSRSPSIQREFSQRKNNNREFSEKEIFMLQFRFTRERKRKEGKPSVGISSKFVFED